MKEVYVLSRIPNLIKDLRRFLPQINFLEIFSEDDERLKKNAEILVGDFDWIGPHLYELEKVKWLQGTWAGVDKLMVHIETSKPLPYLITRYSGQHFGRIMTEYVLACIINHERDWNTMIKNQAKSLWSKDDKIGSYRIISDLNVGIMGIGNIGNKIGSYINGLGGKVFGYGRKLTLTPSDETDYLNEYYSKANFSEFLKMCDYLINVLPSTKETEGLLNGNVLECCKDRQTIFINIGRGTIINEDDLIKALNNGWLAHAYLDVFSIEPLPKESPLWKMSNVTVTPHVSGLSRSQDIAQQFRDNYILYLDNKKIPTEVNISKGY